MTLTIRPMKHLPGPKNFIRFGDVISYSRTLFESLFQARRGHLECSVLLTLTAGAASTTLTDPRISIQTAFGFDPLTSNAALEKAAGTLYATEANRGTGSIVITHANNGQTDRTYIVTMLG
jgi:hypothetical protein